MINKKIFIIFSVILILILIGGYFGIKYVKNKNQQIDKAITEEYIPEEEITEEQMRRTIVSLYFPSKETREITPEARLIDIKEIINTPYERLVTLLIEGPKSDKNQKVIPENTKLLKTYLEDDCVVLDFSEELLNYNKEDQKEKSNLINSLVNTLTELTEVNKVKILINGNTCEEFNEIYTRKK